MAQKNVCAKHKDGIERLDETKSKIILYCVHCEAEKEYEEALSDKSKRYKYLKYLPKYKRIYIGLSTQLFVFFCMIISLAILTAFIVEKMDFSLIIVGVLLNLFLVGISIHDMLFSYNAKQKILDRALPSLNKIIELNNFQHFMYQKEVNEFKEQLYRQYMNRVVDFSEIDTMDGFEFEIYIAELLNNLDFERAIVTKKSGDFGVDIFTFNKNHEKVAVQCKRYGIKNLVGIDAIQQINSAMGYFDCQKAMVITNSDYSKPAYQMAQKLGVELWNRGTLKEKIASVNKENWNDYLDRFYHAPIQNVHPEDGKNMYV